MTARSATSILGEIRNGHLVAELSEAIHEAIAASREHGKAAKVNLEITIQPLRKGAEHLVQAPIVITAEVGSKLPKPDLEATIYFVDKDGNATLQPTERQREMPLSVASQQQG